MMKMNSSTTAQMSRIEAIRSAQLWRGALGRKFGRTKAMMLMVAMYMPTARMPGTMPAMNSLPMSCSVISP